jgi:hypothetical protein
VLNCNTNRAPSGLGIGVAETDTGGVTGGVTGGILFTGTGTGTEITVERGSG